MVLVKMKEIAEAYLGKVRTNVTYRVTCSHVVPVMCYLSYIAITCSPALFVFCCAVLETRILYADNTLFHKDFFSSYTYIL